MNTTDQTLLGLPDLQEQILDSSRFELVQDGANYKVSYGKVRSQILGELDTQQLLSGLIGRLDFSQYCQEAPQDGKLYLRQNGRWVDAGITSPPTTNHPLLRWGNQWVRLDRADWKIVRADQGPLDLKTAQIFRLDGAQDKDILFTNLPEEGRAIFVSLIFNGSGGVFNWPSNISWDEDHAPSMGPKMTVINMIWYGDGWVAHVFARL